jgi:hypothetical protein
MALNRFFEWVAGYGQVAGCCEDSNIAQGLGQILVNGDYDIAEWQDVVRTVILHMAVCLNRFFSVGIRIDLSGKLLW